MNLPEQNVPWKCSPVPEAFAAATTSEIASAIFLASRQHDLLRLSSALDEANSWCAAVRASDANPDERCDLLLVLAQLFRENLSAWDSSYDEPPARLQAILQLLGNLAVHAPSFDSLSEPG